MRDRTQPTLFQRSKGSCKRPTAIQLQNHVRIKLDSMKRLGESYSALIERLLEEVVLYREETKFVLMNQVTKE